MEHVYSLLDTQCFLTPGADPVLEDLQFIERAPEAPRVEQERVSAYVTPYFRVKLLLRTFSSRFFTISTLLMTFINVFHASLRWTF